MAPELMTLPARGLYVRNTTCTIATCYMHVAIRDNVLLRNPINHASYSFSITYNVYVKIIFRGRFLSAKPFNCIIKYVRR